ncbi:bifunctional diguanylate cyclase/phosphodiesterase [Geminocystis sp. NIES-3709]|uniref:putative bifunctional diguanylate cyclase/phosphodiesterase n=1 Tax=Geminocystis sp. NIES-3709 TaxID=1617448 RepID=UPI0005FC5A3E|nr:EAL domain-containing protein [Geminocystis sp. NIES-3709]BAQ65213.1 diguanylate cyclase/phosphodiesterase with PAS/PAC sensor [Geminocystis sp. NIES-3709]
MSRVNHESLFHHYQTMLNSSKWKRKKHFLKYIKTNSLSPETFSSFLDSYGHKHLKQDFLLIMLHDFMEQALDKALLEDEFNVYYQPIIQLNNQQVIGAEALIRWCHPEWGLISPNKFISIAEENELIIPIGKWILNQACLQAKKFLSYPLFNLSVNISPYQFRDPYLVTSILRTLRDIGFPPEKLILEITESALLDNYSDAIKMMNQLKSFGISLALDDFGTGYACLSHLHQLPFDIIKFDKSFISNLIHNPRKKAIFSGLIDIAKKLKLKIYVEGIERLSELNFLQNYDIDRGQGFLFSKPIPIEQFESYMNKNNHSPMLFDNLIKETF